MSFHHPTRWASPVCSADGQPWPCDHVRRIIYRCEDCGAEWVCRWCPSRRDWITGRFQRQHKPAEHATAARVQRWTVWREPNGTRQTILCPSCRDGRDIVAHVRPLPERRTG